MDVGKHILFKCVEAEKNFENAYGQKSPLQMYMGRKVLWKCIGAEKAVAKVYGRQALCKCIWAEKSCGNV